MHEVEKEIEPLGAKIRRLRFERGVGQEKLALQASVDQSGLSKFERGGNRRLSKQSLSRLADALGLTYAELIRDTDRAT